MTEAADPVDFRAELLARKQAALDAMAAKKRKAARDGKALAEGRLTPEDLARELEEAPIVAGPGEPPPEDGARAGGGGEPPPKKPSRPRGEIWDGCPVKPLGVNGDHCYYLDRHGQLRAVKEHKNGTIVSLFGEKNQLLCQYFPTYGKSGTEPQKFRFDAQRATMTMVAACAERGLFNPQGSVRGAGAWCDDDGRLIYHCGSYLITPEGRQDPGEVAGKIYPAYPPIPEPAAAVGRSDPAPEVLAMFSSWRWEHQEVMPMVALGMWGVQAMGGALDWRPVYWLTGDKAYGKSAFQDLIRHLHGGDKGLVQSNDPTKSGITARLGHASLPVALDEIEPDEESSAKGKALIELARVAASGGQWLRGSADQTGASGNVYSAFLFSSILIPGQMGPQDRSRLITLHLRPLDTSAPKLILDARKLRTWGAVMKRALIDRWPSWAERLSLWRVALAEVGLSGRNGDNWATTLAMADAVLHEALPSAEVLAGWAAKAVRAAAHETEEIGSDADSMLMHLMGQPYDVFRRGEMFTVAQWVQVAAQLPAAPKSLVGSCAGISDVAMLDDDLRAAAAKEANNKLAKAGLRVRDAGEKAALFIPSSPLPGLKKLFEHSTWANGVWKQSASRIVGAEPVRNALTLAGQSSRGVYVPLRNVPGMLAFPMDRAPTQSVPPAAPPMPDEWGEGW